MEQPSIVLGTTGDVGPSSMQQQREQQHAFERPKANAKPVAGPLPPIRARGGEDITDGDKKSRANHDYELDSIDKVKSAPSAGSGASGNEADDEESGKAIAGKVVDFELTPAGGHNKAKIKKKKKKKKKMGEEKFKKWGKKQKAEKKKYDKKHKESMKKKKEEGKKKKKKWGQEVHGQKKKGKFKKKK